LKRRIFFSLTALVACRGVLGIEELELADSGASKDGASDAPSDAVGQPDTDKTDGISPGGCATAGNCRQCCRQTFGKEIDEAAYLGKDSCFCGAVGKCSTDCAAGLCVDAAPKEPCGPCIDGQIIKPASKECEDMVTACVQRPSCKVGVDCLKSCP
jgi:hypothetical protein